MEVLKQIIEVVQKTNIMEGVKEELNKRQVDRNTFQTNGLLEEVVSKVHGSMMEVMQLQTLNSGSADQKCSSNYDDNELLWQSMNMTNDGGK